MNNRRLSPIRVLILITALAGAIYYMFQSANQWKNSWDINESKNPWFASYVDVTATPHYQFEQIDENQEQKNAVLSFIVSDKEDACVPTWGSHFNLDEARDHLDLDRRIARLRQQGGNIVVSFGGLLNDEIAVNCDDKNKLIAAYQQVINRYELDTIDLDLEGEGLTNKEAMARRAKAFSVIQQRYHDQGKHLSIWLTLPVSTHGLTEDGTDAVAEFLAMGVDIAGVNGMTMNYGQSKETDEGMQFASQRALTELHRQLGVLYAKADIGLSPSVLWSKIGATPMIGQNDISSEIFTTGDAEGFNAFALNKNIGRMSMWSANRDIKCGGNYVNTNIVSDSCSGVDQEKNQFSNLLGKGFDGSITENSKKTTVDEEIIEVVDNPEESPYQIWNSDGTYLEGTKVVWHGNVYQAKWWNQGDMPDNPVLQSWETPWELVGPVLPGEKPIPQPELPEGTYPNWDGAVVYDAGARVIFSGVPYQAKWWTQGDSPAAASSQPDSSPWKALTREQIENIIIEISSK